ncbi:MAG TPA: single-stranded-DNA-specific exonuclease RecJ [Xanthomonadaceae bacterium]|nr:single-stranded-DNA-specific exonuclease RecJ [Xanthomonadaceae bacterium]
MSPVRLRRREASAWTERADHLHPVLCRVLAGRGLESPAQAEYRLAALAQPDRLGGMDGACRLLADAIDKDRAILVVGDFDADGATGSAVAVRGLRMLGARRVGFRVPHRMRHGYGLSPALVDEVAAGEADLILTVDNGVASHAGVERARARGMRVVISDHHLPGATLPGADAIVNPNLPGDPFPSKALAGVGVVFYLLLALRARLRADGHFAAGAEPDLRSLLDLVAVGTVADLVPLDYNNRVLVDAGLRRIRAGRASAGIAALLDVAGRDPARIAASDLGFAVAPRINAAGRLDDMSIGIACLLSDDPDQARELAAILDGINRERRSLQRDMLAQADAAVAELDMQAGGDGPVGLSLFRESWHPGVVGLVASRLKERLHRPVVAFAPGEDGELRGSARSIPGFHVRDALAAVDATHPGLIERFGGHAMAAGLSLRLSHYPAFAEHFDAVARRCLDAEALARVVLTDGPLGASDYDHALACALRDAGPWGQAFPEPLFDDVFDICDYAPMGQGHLRMRVRVEGMREPVAAVEFGHYHGDDLPDRLRLAFQLEPDEWRGRRAARLLVRHRLPA